MSKIRGAVVTNEEKEEMARMYDDSPDRVGEYGEILTATSLRNNCGMRVCRMLYIGKSQIDVIGISKGGVFVVENKNYHAIISGNMMDRYWKVGYSPHNIHKLYNPAWQNKVHCDDVKELLASNDFADVPVHSLVIFNDLAQLVIKGNNRQIWNLTSFVRYYCGNEIKQNIDVETEEKLYKLLLGYQDFSEEAKARHLALFKGSDLG